MSALQNPLQTAKMHSAKVVLVDGGESLSQLNASSTSKARPAKLYHAATDVDREDNHASGSNASTT
jgi:hypothetical protein